METTIERNREHETGSVKSINYSNGEFIIKEIPVQLNGQYSIDQLPGVLCKGVQYYDLKDVGFINNTGMASLIDLLKSLLKQGVETQFVNVNEPIRKKISSLGLDRILKCA
jgi:ABC-type transporter Mla MlaB component